MKILILFATLIFSLATFADDTQADWFSPGSSAKGYCPLCQQNGARLGNKRGVCITRGCGQTPGSQKGSKPANAAGVSN